MKINKFYFVDKFYFVCLTVLQMAGDYPDRN